MGVVPAREKNADGGRFPEVPGSTLGSGLCSASSYGQDISSEALKLLG